jgi:putative transposase
MSSQFNPEKHHRKSIRLKNFDYGKSKLYFLTFNTHKRKRIFGYVKDGQMIYSQAGLIAIACWKEIPMHHPYVILHAFIIMPDHVHGIIEIVDNRTPSVDTRSPALEETCDGQESREDHFPPKAQRQTHYYTESGKRIELSPKFQSPSKTIGSIIRGYKIGVTKWFRAKGVTTDVWQRNYYDRIIWDDDAFANITRYIENNPKNFGKKQNPAAPK